MIRRRTLLGGMAATLAAPAIARRRATAGGPDVLVLGAGLAGLEAALRLEAGGARVLVLEARDRVGGRVHSLAGTPGVQEAGGTGIVAGYRRFVARAREGGLELKPASGLSDFGSPETAIHWRGVTMGPKDWPGHAVNPLPAALRDRMPWQLGLADLAALNPLAAPADWRAPQHAVFDGPVGGLLVGRGFDGEALRMAFGTNPGYADAWQWSALMAFHVLAAGRALGREGAGPLLVDGGNDRVAQAMAGRLRTPPRLGVRIAGIGLGPFGVHVLADSGERFTAPHAVSTLPLPALRGLFIDPAPPPAVQALIASVPYNRVLKIFLEPRGTFGDPEGLPVAMWTDTLAGRVMGMRATPGGPTVAVMAFVTGPAADRLDRMAPGDRSLAVIHAIETARPGLRGLLSPMAEVSWGQDAFAGGAYACWAPGQVTALAGLLDEPLGALHWAGEHAAIETRGLEGALESGERAAAAILAL